MNDTLCRDSKWMQIIFNNSITLLTRGALLCVHSCASQSNGVTGVMLWKQRMHLFETLSSITPFKKQLRSAVTYQNVRTPRCKDQVGHTDQGVTLDTR